MTAATARRTRADGVAETLKRRILGGSYAPGAKLPAEPALAEALGVHRFTVREALSQLEQMRLVERRPGSGTVVLDFASHASVEVLEYLVLREDGTVAVEVLSDALEFARLVSTEIAGLAAERRSSSDLAALDVAVERLERESNVGRLFWLDFELNWALATAARNVVPRLLLNSVRELLARHAPLLETLWTTPGTIAEGYVHVVAAVRARDAARARELVTWIWTSRRERFVEAAERFSLARAARASQRPPPVEGAATTSDGPGL
ncbi:MAG: FadR family transcriptional regulator [Polyangiaceae bacterium]|nr:FadR family transcriptional regulator [Polyangiaceae bacterium]